MPVTLSKKAAPWTALGGRKGAANAVLVGRLIFSLCLCLVAVVLGWCAYFFLQASETELAEVQFGSVADRALSTAYEITARKRLGTISMASVAGNAIPDPNRWPFATINGYEEMANNLIDTSTGRSMGFCPLVTPKQLPLFEDFAYDFFENKRKPPFPNGTAVNSFGKGVWGEDKTMNTTDNRYRVTDGSTYYDSPYDVIAPILQHSSGASDVLMLNIRFHHSRGELIDTILDCSRYRNETRNEQIECGGITDMIFFVGSSVEDGPSALLMAPVYAADDKLHGVVGIIASTIMWSEVLVNVFADEVDGVDCVVATDTQQYTYKIHAGEASVSGEGDLHDRRYSHYRRDVKLTGEGLFNNHSSTYTLALYPTDEFFNVYTTPNPTVAMVGAVCIIVFTSLLFFVYDYCVRREFSSNKELLEAKRRFVRYVSHEVRTPLNTVCMGLTLMHDEIASAIGYTPIAREEEKRCIVPSSSSTAAEAATVLNNDTATSWFKQVNQLLNNAQNAVDVLNDMLNYDRIEMGTLNLELTVLPIWTVIDRTAQEFRFPAANKKIQLIVTYTEDSSPPMSFEEIPPSMNELQVVGDKIRVIQTLRNLISNAIKFNPEGGSLTVTASRLSPDKGAESLRSSLSDHGKSFVLQNGEKLVVEQKGYLRVDVTDTGAGMTESQLSRLFQAGVQFNVNELQAGQGSGLGLYITKGIVEQHGGELSVRSDGLGKGTTFTMTLPLYHVPRACSSTDPCSNLSVTNEATHDGDDVFVDSDGDRGKAIPQHILVVDDANMNRKLLIRLLESHGHVCDGAKDGQQAVDKVVQRMACVKEQSISEVGEDREAGPPMYHTILLDYEMPIMNGPTAAQKIRSLGYDSLIVGITGNCLPEDVQFFKSRGANTVLPKPFQLEDLEQLWDEYNVPGSANDRVRKKLCGRETGSMPAAITQVPKAA